MAGESIGHWALRALAALILMMSAQPACAAVGDVGQPIPTCIARAVPGMTPQKLLRQPGGFDCATPQTDFGSGDFWIRSMPFSRIDTRSPHEIRTASLWQQKTTLYALYADGRIYRFVDDSRALSRHIQLGAIVQHQTPPSTVPLVRLLWHVEGSANLRGVLLGARISDSYEAGQSNLKLGALYAGFVGLCLALLMYNLALWGALNYRFQPPYCVMIGALLLYAIFSSGALAWIVPGMDNNDRLRINYLLLAISAASAVAFARAFFEDRIFFGWLRPASRIAMIAVLTPAVLFALFAPMEIWLIDRLYAVTFLGLIAIVVPILWRAWRLRSNFLWLFAIGWAAPIALACVRIANTFHAIPWSFWLDNSTIVSMTMETIVSSLAIAYRIHLLSRDRDDARIQEAAARLLADTDPLTGLLNRRAFLREAIGRTGEQTLLIADIDHFKRVNDTLGHDGGDEVLRLFARALRMAAPADALVARIGGEEFAIVAPAATGLEPDAILARLRAERMPFDLTVTASIGLCTGPLLSEAHWKLLYCTADRALFDAKADGRDRARAAYSVAYAA
ncbi:diguanylate cyclase [Sphingomonas koreensis]|nr:diguanylate cyclase [Sphingomonas koreensis]